MDRVPQIIKREELEAWLASRSHKECIAIANRSALRVAPLWIGKIKIKFMQSDQTEIVFLRALLISYAATSEKREIKTAALASYRLHANEDHTYMPDPHDSDLVANEAATSARNAVGAVARTVVNGDKFLEMDGAQSAGYSAACEAKFYPYDEDRYTRWRAIQADLYAINSGIDPFRLPLWHHAENPFVTDWTRARAELVARGPDWDFWVRWYDAALRGQPLNWKMQEEIALLPSKVWEGNVAGLAAAIAAIEKKYSKVRKPRQANPKPDVIGELLDGEKKGSKSAISKVKAAIDQHHRELPATFDAVLGFISLEIHRLQQKNYQSDNERDEAVRQIEVLTILDAAVRAIQATIPAQAPIDLKEAEKVEKLYRLFARKFGEWPRANADDLVDNTCRFALVGAVTCLAPMIGVSALSVFIGAGTLFGGPKIAGLVKLAVDAKTSAAPPS